LATCAPLGNFAKINPPFLGLEVESLDSRWKSSKIFPERKTLDRIGLLLQLD